MWDLLTPDQQRPDRFGLGSDVYDQEKVGFVHEVLEETAEASFVQASGDLYTGKAFVLDTALRGNGNQGHTGPEYGTEFSDDKKRSLIEYLKKL